MKVTRFLFPALSMTGGCGGTGNHVDEARAPKGSSGSSRAGPEVLAPRDVVGTYRLDREVFVAKLRELLRHKLVKQDKAIEESVGEFFGVAAAVAGQPQPEAPASEDRDEEIARIVAKQEPALQEQAEKFEVELHLDANGTYFLGFGIKPTTAHMAEGTWKLQGDTISLKPTKADKVLDEVMEGKLKEGAIHLIQDDERIVLKKET